MSKPAYLKARGPNNVEIISMIFESFETGLAWLNIWFPEMEIKVYQRDGFREANHTGYLDDEAKHKTFFDAIFTSWYFGCGSAHTVSLVELKDYNTPLCGFDLD